MRQRPWLVLVGGFGGLLFLMAGGGTAAFLALSDLRASNTRAQQHFLARSRALEQIRSSRRLKVWTTGNDDGT